MKHLSPAAVESNVLLWD